MAASSETGRGPVCVCLDAYSALQGRDPVNILQIIYLENNIFLSEISKSPG